MKKLLTLLLAFGLLGGAVPVMAEETGVSANPGSDTENVTVTTVEYDPASIPAWAYGEVADGYALGLFGDEIYTAERDKTVADLTRITKVVADKLALLDVPVNPNPDQGKGLVVDSTRGGVLNALYQEAAAYQFEGIEEANQALNAEDGAILYLRSLGVVHGDGADLALDRPCTLLEAACFADRMILALYDQCNAGSLGLLWKAEGNGNTLYLLGSIHTDRSNLYPFHKQLRDIITSAGLAAFELDFNDQSGIEEFTAMQTYSDGTTLSDHISPELYQEVVEALVPLGMTEEAVAQLKPWALANSFTSLSMLDETSGDSPMAIDLYVNAKAANVGVPIEGVETYAFQGGIFEDLSAEYQENYLALTLAMFQGADADGLDQESIAALEAQNAAVDEWMEQWKARDIQGFADSYPKDAMMADGSDELNRKLFEGRDPNMAAWADRYLKQPGSHTGLMTVGAGHMIGSTGIVQSLRDLGYTVEVMPLP